MKPLRIGAMLYTVELMDEIPAIGLPEHMVAYGQENELYSRIRIRKDAKKRLKLQILLHEIFHAILNTAGNSSQEHHEYTIDALAYGLLDFVRQNPGFFSKMEKVLQEDEPNALR